MTQDDIIAQLAQAPPSMPIEHIKHTHCIRVPKEGVYIKFDKPHTDFCAIQCETDPPNECVVSHLKAEIGFHVAVIFRPALIHKRVDRAFRDKQGQEFVMEVDAVETPAPEAREANVTYHINGR